MIYFDNAATGGRKPDAVLNAVASSIKVCANPGRSGHKLSLSCAKIVEDCRNALNEYFQGYGYDSVVFTKNCTEALNLAIFGLLKMGDHVVASCMEHNSVLRPLERLKKLGVITYDICALDHTNNLDLEMLSALVKPTTKMAIITTASNVTGAAPPLAEIRKRLPKNTLLLCDGAQGGGHLPIRMQETGIDLLTVAGHKGMMGIQGSGALLFSPRAEPTPLLYGGTGSMSISLDMPDFYPDGLEAGTLSFPAVFSLLEGVRYLTLHAAQLENRLPALTAYCVDGIKKLPDYQLFSPPNPCGIVAFRHKYIPSEYVAEMLSADYGVAVRGGLHCAPLMHEALRTLDSGLIRASFSPFNGEREIDVFLSALEKIAKT